MVNNIIVSFLGILHFCKSKEESLAFDFGVGGDARKLEAMAINTEKLR